MDVGTVGGWSWEDYDEDGVYALGCKGKGEDGKGNGKR